MSNQPLHHLQYEDALTDAEQNAPARVGSGSGLNQKAALDKQSTDMSSLITPLGASSSSNSGFHPAKLGRRLGKSTRTITRCIEEGLIVAKLFGRTWVIDRSEVERIDREGVGRSRHRLKVKTVIHTRQNRNRIEMGVPRD